MNTFNASEKDTRQAEKIRRRKIGVIIELSALFYSRKFNYID